MSFDIQKLIDDCHSTFELQLSKEKYFNIVINKVVEAIGCQYGYIGTIKTDLGGDVVTMFAISRGAWTESLLKMHNDLQCREGTMDQRNTNNMIFKPIIDGKTVIINDTSDFKLPIGHNKLENYVGIPIIYFGKKIGVIGFANKECGFDEEFCQQLTPFIDHLCFMLSAYGHLTNRETIETEIFDNYPMPVAFLDVTLNVVWGNIKLRNLIYPHRYVEFLDLLYLKNGDKVVDILSKDKNTYSNGILKLKNGTDKNIAITHLVNLDDSSNGRLHQLFIEDITQKKILEDEKDLYEMAFNTSIDYFAVSDITTTKFLVLNKTWENLGYTLEELKSKSFYNFIHPDDVPDADVAVTDIRDNQAQLQNFENRYIKKNGDIVWFSWAAVPLANKPGIVIAYARDITQTKQIHKELIEAKQRAIDANNAKNHFLSRVSHELRTPLNSILGFAQLLEYSELGDDEIDNVKSIIKSGKFLLNMINDVLDISRIESDKFQISIEKVSLKEVVRESVDLVRHLADEKDIVIKISSEIRDNILVKVDKQRLKQIVLNLLSNAVKYNRDRGIINVDLVILPSEEIELHIRDTGIGIPENKMKHLFEPFNRMGAEGTTIQGVGLGLALSKKLAEMLGIDLQCQSIHRKGSDFYLAFNKDMSILHGQVSTEKYNGVENINTILYIEDNQQNYHLFNKIISKMSSSNIQLLTSMQGSVGFDLAKYHKPQLIFLDLNLPDMNGDKVLQKLKGCPETQNIPVYILSADASSSTIHRIKEIGCVDYITKPFNIKHIIKIINDHIKPLPIN